MEAKQVLRTLLRAIDKNITQVSNNRTWHDYVVSKFREGRSLADPEAIKAQLQLAKDYAAYISNISNHKRLLVEYNIGLDVDERTKRMVEATARRVGFALPDSK
jgi:hypothetical protein